MADLKKLNIPGVGELDMVDANAVKRTEDTMEGKLVANATANPTAKQVRNILIGTEEPGSDAGANGDVFLVYTA